MGRKKQAQGQSDQESGFKTLVYNIRPINSKHVFKYQGYAFQFDDKLQPIPVSVPSDVADVLLQMKGREDPCCKGRGGNPLFLEV